LYYHILHVHAIPTLESTDSMILVAKLMLIGNLLKFVLFYYFTFSAEAV